MCIINAYCKLKCPAIYNNQLLCKYTSVAHQKLLVMDNTEGNKTIDCLQSKYYIPSLCVNCCKFFVIFLKSYLHHRKI